MQLAVCLLAGLLACQCTDWAQAETADTNDHVSRESNPDEVGAAPADGTTPEYAHRGRGHGRGGPWRGGRGPGYGRGGPWRGGRGPDTQFEADRELFHFLLDHREAIRRKVKKQKDGVSTLTESDDPEVAEALRKHVASMVQRVEQGQPIRMRDPLFAEIFRHADKIDMQVEPTDKGLRVVETSSDPYVARLIQAHAKVVTRFLKHGYPEARANHAAPKR
jgi:hypothetical protein